MPVFVPLAARLILAGVFGLAGFAKFSNLRNAAQSLVPFGIPERKSGVAAKLLATAEVVFAVAVLPTATALVGSAGITVLLLLFIAVIAVTLQRGQTPQCHCFGQLKSEPIGPRVLARNTLLLALAVIVIADASPAAAQGAIGDMSGASWPDAVRALSDTSPVWVVAVIGAFVVFALAMALVTVLRQYGRLLIRVERLEHELGLASDAKPAGLPVGTPMPSFTLSTLDGQNRSLAGIGQEGDTVAFVFIEPGCGPCAELLPDVAAISRQATLAARVAPKAGRTPRRTVIALVSQGTADENRTKTSAFGFEHVLLQREREVANAFAVVGTPSAVLVRNGLVASPLAAGPDAVRELLEGAVNRTGAPLIGLGDEVPAIDLPDLNGRMVDLRTLTDARALLLFWNPTCGYCEQMLPHLKDWQRRADASEPALVLVSQGSAALNREQGIRATTVLDEGFVLGKSLGAQGTPSGVIVENGRVVSEVGVGAHDVFALVSTGVLAARA